MSTSPRLVTLFTFNRGATTFVAAGGSVLDFVGDAIVNAANEGCVGGGGVDGAVNDAGGKDLVAARRALGGCATGSAKSTPSYGLKKVQHIIHAVGPSYHGWHQSAEEASTMGAEVAKKDTLLEAAYRAAVKEAAKLNARQVGFSLLSAGIFRGNRSLEDVLTIGIESVMAASDDLAATTSSLTMESSAAAAAASVLSSSASSAAASSSTTWPGFTTICFVAFTGEERDTLKRVFEKVASKSTLS